MDTPDPIEDADAALVDRARRAAPGDTRAFEALVERHRGRVVANCRYLVAPSQAEDLAQEVLVKAYFALRGYERRAKFSTWLYRIKVNHCLNHRRGERKRRGEVALDELPMDAAELRVDADAESRLWRQADVATVRGAVQRLPDTLRLPLVMRELDEMSYDDIATALGISLPAVKMRLLRARQELRAALGAPRV